MAANTPNSTLYPELPLEAWESTKDTLHLYAQIVGKIRMTLTPRRNHWWHVPLYVTPSGLTTTTIPYDEMTFVIDFDFIKHQLVVMTSRGERKTIDLYDGLTVAQFYNAVFETLEELGISVSIKAEPFDHKSKTPFTEDNDNKSYNKPYIERYHQVIMQVDSILKEFATHFTGKSSPVHLFWHSFDIALTFFSGKKGPDMSAADSVTQDAYSHEVISFGWWAGDQKNQFPAFYAYAFPEPEALLEQPLKPETAFWQTGPNGSLALLKYDDIRQMENPRQAVLAFLMSAYQAGCKAAAWDIEGNAYAFHPSQQR